MQWQKFAKIYFSSKDRQVLAHFSIQSWSKRRRHRLRHQGSWIAAAEQLPTIWFHADGRDEYSECFVGDSTMISYDMHRNSYTCALETCVPRPYIETKCTQLYKASWRNRKTDCMCLLVNVNLILLRCYTGHPSTQNLVAWDAEFLRRGLT